MKISIFRKKISIYIYSFWFQMPEMNSTEDSWCLHTFFYRSFVSQHLELLKLLYKYIFFFVIWFVLNVTVSFCVSLYLSFVYVTVQFSCYLIIIDNCQSSTFLTGVITPYTIFFLYPNTFYWRRCKPKSL